MKENEISIIEKRLKEPYSIEEEIFREVIFGDNTYEVKNHFYKEYINHLESTCRYEELVWIYDYNVSRKKPFNNEQLERKYELSKCILNGNRRKFAKIFGNVTSIMKADDLFKERHNFFIKAFQRGKKIKYYEPYRQVNEDIQALSDVISRQSQVCVENNREKWFELIKTGNFNRLFKELREILVEYGKDSNIIEEYSYLDEELPLNMNDLEAFEITYYKCEALIILLKAYNDATDNLIEYIENNNSVNMKFFDLLGKIYNEGKLHNKIDLFFKGLVKKDIENNIGYLVFLKRTNNKDELKEIFINVLERIDENALYKYKEILDDILEYIIDYCVDSIFTDRLFLLEKETSFLNRILLKYSIAIDNLYYILKYADDKSINDKNLIDSKNDFVEKKLTDFKERIQKGQLEFLENLMHHEISYNNRFDKKYNKDVEYEFKKSIEGKTTPEKYDEILKFLVKYPRIVLLWHQLSKYTFKQFNFKTEESEIKVREFFVRIQSDLYDEYYLDPDSDFAENEYLEYEYRNYAKFLIFKGNENVIDDFHIRRFIYISKVIYKEFFDDIFYSDYKKNKDTILDDYIFSLNEAQKNENIFGMKNKDFIFDNIDFLKDFVNLVEIIGIKGSDVLTKRFQEQSVNIINKIKVFLEKVESIMDFPKEDYDLKKYILGKLKHKNKKKVELYLDKEYDKNHRNFYKFVNFFKDNLDKYDSKLVINFIDSLFYSGNNMVEIISNFKIFSNYLLYDIDKYESKELLEKIYKCKCNDTNYLRKNKYFRNIIFYPILYYMGLENLISKEELLESYDEFFQNIPYLCSHNNSDTLEKMIKFLYSSIERMLYIGPRDSGYKDVLENILYIFNENRTVIEKALEEIKNNERLMYAFNNLQDFIKSIPEIVKAIGGFESIVSEAHDKYFDELIEDNNQLTADHLKDLDVLISNEEFCDYLSVIDRKNYFETIVMFGKEKIKEDNEDFIIGQISDDENMKMFIDLLEYEHLLNYTENIMNDSYSFMKHFKEVLKGNTTIENIQIHFIYVITRFGIDSVKRDYGSIFKNYNENTQHLKKLIIQYDNTFSQDLYLKTAHIHFKAGEYEQAFKDYEKHIVKNKLIYEDLSQSRRNEYLISNFFEVGSLEIFNIRPEHLKSVIKRLQTEKKLSGIKETFYNKIIEDKAYRLCLIWDILSLTNRITSGKTNYSVAKLLTKKLVDLDQNNIILEEYYSKRIKEKSRVGDSVKQVTSIDDLDSEDYLCIENDITKYSRSILLKDNYYLEAIQPSKNPCTLNIDLDNYSHLSNFLYDQYAWLNIQQDKLELTGMIEKAKSREINKYYKTNHGRLTHLYSISIFYADDMNTILDQLYNMVINLTKSNFFYEENYRVSLIYCDAIRMLIKHNYFKGHTEKYVNILNHFWLVLKNQKSIDSVIESINLLIQGTENYDYMDNYNEDVKRILREFHVLKDYSELTESEKVKMLRALIQNKPSVKVNDPEIIEDAKEQLEGLLKDELFDLNKNLDQYDLFISYSHGDYEYILELYNALKNSNLNLDIWMDERLDSNRYQSQITAALKKSENVIFMVSDNMLSSMLNNISYIYHHEYLKANKFKESKHSKVSNIIFVSMTGQPIKLSYLEENFYRKDLDIDEERKEETEDFVIGISEFNQVNKYTDTESLVKEISNYIK